MSHKTAPPSRGYLQLNEVCCVLNSDGLRYTVLESFEYVYDVSKLTTQKDFFVATICELIDSGFEGIKIGFFGNFDKIKIEINAQSPRLSR